MKSNNIGIGEALYFLTRGLASGSCIGFLITHIFFGANIDAPGWFMIACVVSFITTSYFYKK